METVGISFEEIKQTFTKAQEEFGSPSITETQRFIVQVCPVAQRESMTPHTGKYQLVSAHIKSSWFNPPRRRRHLMKATMEWHEFYCNLNQLASWLDRSVSSTEGHTADFELLMARVEQSSCSCSKLYAPGCDDLASDVRSRNNSLWIPTTALLY